MKRIVMGLAVLIAALGLVACGGGGSSSSSTGGNGGDGSVSKAAIAEGVALYREHERLEALAAKGIHRMSMAVEYGSKAEVESLEEAEAEIKAEADKVFSELNGESNAVQRAVLKQVQAEK
jgi:hypothetical protein